MCFFYSFISLFRSPSVSLFFSYSLRLPLVMLPFPRFRLGLAVCLVCASSYIPEPGAAETFDRRAGAPPPLPPPDSNRASASSRAPSAASARSTCPTISSHSRIVTCGRTPAAAAAPRVVAAAAMASAWQGPWERTVHGQVELDDLVGVVQEFLCLVVSSTQNESDPAVILH